MYLSIYLEFCIVLYGDSFQRGGGSVVSELSSFQSYRRMRFLISMLMRVACFKVCLHSIQRPPLAEARYEADLNRYCLLYGSIRTTLWSFKSAVARCLLLPHWMNRTASSGRKEEKERRFRRLREKHKASYNYVSHISNRHYLQSRMYRRICSIRYLKQYSNPYRNTTDIYI